MKKQNSANTNKKNASQNNIAKADQDAKNVRIDKWLWAARFCKTRAIARELVQSGKVQYNKQRCKSSKLVELDATIQIPAGFDQKIVIVKEVIGQRRSAQLAQLLYEETAESIALREKNAVARKLSIFHSPRPDGRPDKKQRRQIIQFKHQ
ncbi:ribosome-associated heat shock protein Hsp15 [Brumicola pallidula]|jgi:ribosome-associated heat shock protein Hsp15|uniref:Ribosome-associated heat shock protein Hsp15 n=1 Tax=Brumicola pallidula DSM 14239 = ACAM 615 TaxID=1121922 RepID=K6YUD0_9ALTE|nr:ribosome-associated heat shock protein Hsp15 [Glaciecola pallidula]GAC27606.1 ribosome-associated heat shock protein Hsp15 [Glaciecola pallidula DSM 14239 = ACAM 615]